MRTTLLCSLLATLLLTTPGSTPQPVCHESAVVPSTATYGIWSAITCHTP